MKQARLGLERQPVDLADEQRAYDGPYAQAPKSPLGSTSETLGETLSGRSRVKRRKVVGNLREERWSGRLDLNLPSFFARNARQAEPPSYRCHVHAEQTLEHRRDTDHSGSDEKKG